MNGAAKAAPPQNGYGKIEISSKMGSGKHNTDSYEFEPQYRQGRVGEAVQSPQQTGLYKRPDKGGYSQGQGRALKKSAHPPAKKM